MLSSEEGERRRAALDAIIHKERRQADVAREFGVTPQAVSVWVKKYKETGEVISSSKRGRKKAIFLSAERQAQVRERIAKHTPAELQIESDNNLWHWQEIQDLLFQDYQVRFSPKTCFELLAELGVTDPGPSPAKKRGRPRADELEPRPVSKEEAEELQALLQAAKARMEEEPQQKEQERRASAWSYGIRTGKHKKGTAQRRKKRTKPKQRPKRRR